MYQVLVSSPSLSPALYQARHLILISVLYRARHSILHFCYFMFNPLHTKYNVFLNIQVYLIYSPATYNSHLISFCSPTSADSHICIRCFSIGHCFSVAQIEQVEYNFCGFDYSLTRNCNFIFNLSDSRTCFIILNKFSQVSKFQLCYYCANCSIWTLTSNSLTFILYICRYHIENELKKNFLINLATFLQDLCSKWSIPLLSLRLEKKIGF